MARNRSFKVTVTEEELRQIAARADQAGLSIASLARSSALAIEIPKPAIDIDRAAVVALNRIGSNLNQLAKAANTNGFLTPPQLKGLGWVLRSVHDTIQRIERA